jgi:hypothetical protein
MRVVGHLDPPGRDEAFDAALRASETFAARSMPQPTDAITVVPPHFSVEDVSSHFETMPSNESPPGVGGFRIRPTKDEPLAFQDGAFCPATVRVMRRAGARIRTRRERNADPVRCFRLVRDTRVRHLDKASRSSRRSGKRRNALMRSGNSRPTGVACSL